MTKEQTKRQCARDSTHTFVPRSWNQIYCSGACKRRIENERKRVEKVEIETQTRAEQLEEVLGQAAEFVREHKSLPPVPEQIRATKLEDMGFNTAQQGVAEKRSKP